MKLLQTVLLGAAVAVAASPAPATSPIAEVICAPTERMQARLTRQFGERRTASGLRSPDEVMEVWTDAEGGWTLVMRYAHGTSCIVAMGEHWETAPQTGRG